MLRRDGIGVLSCLVALACAPGAVVAQTTLAQAPVASAGAGAATLDVVKYREQEGRLLAALSQRDRPSLAALLAPEFSARWSGTDSADADAWLAHEGAAASTAASIRDLSVRKVAELDLVCFYLVHPGSAVRGPSAEFVVDAWRAADGKLVARFSNPAKAPPARDKRPDGRG